MDSRTFYKIMLKKCPDTKRNKHYLKRYIRFIQRCIKANQSLTTNTYMENHHILPKSKYFWFEYLSFKDFPWNRARLTYRQHFIAHWMLYKSLSGKMCYAFKRMCDVENKIRKGDLFISSRTYEQVKKKVHDIECNKKLSEETKNKIREKRKLQVMGPCSDEKKQKIREANLGRKRTEEAIIKQKESIKIRPCERHPRALVIHIYDNNQDLMFVCKGNMRKICKENDLPFSIFRKSLIDNKPIEKSTKFKKGKREEIRRPFIGWRAVYAD